MRNGKESFGGLRLRWTHGTKQTLHAAQRVDATAAKNTSGRSCACTRRFGSGLALNTILERLTPPSQLLLRKVAEDYNPSDKIAAMRLLHETARRGEFATGILYIEPDKDDFIESLNLVDTPLAFLTPEQVRPPKAVLDELMESLR